MVAHESARGGHYRPRMKTRVAQLGWLAASEQDGPAHRPLEAMHSGVVVFGGAEDEKSCRIMFPKILRRRRNHSFMEALIQALTAATLKPAVGSSV